MSFEGVVDAEANTIPSRYVFVNGIASLLAYRTAQRHFSKTLNQKDGALEWSNNCQQAFEKLKQSLTTVPILVYPDQNNPFIFTTDAFPTAKGYILGHLDSHGREDVIFYGGHSLNTAENIKGITHLDRRHQKLQSVLCKWIIANVNSIADNKRSTPLTASSRKYAHS